MALFVEVTVVPLGPRWSGSVDTLGRQRITGLVHGIGRTESDVEEEPVEFTKTDTGKGVRSPRSEMSDVVRSGSRLIPGVTGRITPTLESSISRVVTPGGLGVESLQ